MIEKKLPSPDELHPYLLLVFGAAPYRGFTTEGFDAYGVRVRSASQRAAFTYKSRVRKLLREMGFRDPARQFGLFILWQDASGLLDTTKRTNGLLRLKDMAADMELLMRMEEPK